MTQTINELYESYISDFIKYQPFKLSGYLKTIGLFKINSQSLFWEFSSLDAILMTYESIEDYPIKYKNLYKLSDLKDVKIVNNFLTQKSKFFSSKFCFEIEGQSIKKTTFYSLSKSGVELWVNSINKAKSFHQWFSIFKAYKSENKFDQEVITCLLAEIVQK